MHDRPGTTLLVTAVCLLLGLSPPAAAQVMRGGANSAAQASPEVAVGKLKYWEGQYTLHGDDGEILAYLIPRPTLPVDQFVGQVVAVSGRVSTWRRDGQPRVWAEAIAPAGQDEAGYVRQAAYESDAREPLQLAQLQTPVVAPAGAAPQVFDPYGRPPSQMWGPPGRFWADAQYLLWWMDPMVIPPLVTTSPAGTPREDAGVLGEPGTQILYGEDDILTEARHGFRVRSGIWLDPDHRLGVQGEFFGFNADTANFSQSSDAEGNPILARPFFNINPRDPFTLDPDPPAREDSQLVSYPDVLRGAVGVDTSTDLYGLGASLRLNLACDSWWIAPVMPYSRVDLLAGYRFLRLQDKLGITEELVSLDPVSPASFDIFDQFDTRNEFHGVDLGLAWQAGWERWSLELLFRTALGTVRQEVDISGGTVISAENTPAESYAGGLLALPSNIGSYSQNRFAVVPEIGVSLRYEIFPKWYLTAGYTFLFWSSIVRSGDQIDLDVNPDQLAPPIDPIEGPLRPEFVFREVDFWAQGFDLGLQGRW